MGEFRGSSTISGIPIAIRSGQKQINLYADKAEKAESLELNSLLILNNMLASSNHIVDFKLDGVTKASIDSLGKFTGSIDWNKINNKPSTYSPGVHDHNNDYYLKTQVDAALNNKSDKGHKHTEADITNLDKYTQSEIDAKLNTKSNKTHKHDDLYEPIFTKNTAFNKNFGTTYGSIARGNHTHTQYGDMFKATYDTNNSGVIDNAEKVNGYTVNRNVPATAIFSDYIPFDKNGDTVWGDVNINRKTGSAPSIPKPNLIVEGTIKEGGTFLSNKYLGINSTAQDANRLHTARKISLSGDIIGSVNFDGSSNVNITTSFGDIALDEYTTLEYANDHLDSTLASSKQYTDTKIANLVDSSSSTLDTLNELANALGDDPNFATTVTNQIATKANTSHTSELSTYGAATTSLYGHVKISNAVTSSDQTKAATSYAVKKAYDLANAALPKSGGNLSNNIKFIADNTGIELFDGAKIYKKYGDGLKIQAHSNTIGVAIQDTSGTDKLVIKTDNSNNGMTYNGHTVWHAGNMNIAAYSNDIKSVMQTKPDAPTNLTLLENDDKVQIQFKPPTEDLSINIYEIWSSVGNTTSYGLIAQVKPEDIENNLASIIDKSYIRKTNIYYKIYAITNGVRSSPLEGNITLVNNAHEAFYVSVVPYLESFMVQYTIPNDRRIDHVEVYKQALTSSTGFEETSSDLIYTGTADSYTYKIPHTDIDKFHKFWIKTITKI